MNAYKSLIFSTSPWDRLKAFLENQNYSSIHVLMDHHTEKYCFPILTQYLHQKPDSCFIIDAGEASKTMDTCMQIWKHLLQHQVDRKALILCLGGGVVTDLGGFCASVLLRGLDTVYIPTSLMAMADAAIGGKTAVNFDFYKNQLGTFYAPKAIVIDYQFLISLPERQVRNGFVEIIKHSLIAAPSFWSDLVDLDWPIDHSLLCDLVKKSIRTKTEIVEKDYEENGLRKILNFGHSIGHALESFCMAKGQDILHGEAVAAGMICEAFLSSQRFKWKTQQLEQLTKLLRPFTGNLQFKTQDYPEILHYLNADKKKLKRQIQFCLVEQIGTPRLDQIIDEEQLFNSLDFYNLNETFVV